MKFKDIYFGYVGIICGFDTTTNNHIISNASGYDLYTQNGKNIFTKEVFPVCHISGKAIDLGTKGVTLTQATKIITSINPETDFDDEMLLILKKFIKEKNIFNQINQNLIATELNKVLKTKQTASKQQKKSNIIEKLLPLKKSKKQTTENENNISI